MLNDCRRPEAPSNLDYPNLIPVPKHSKVHLLSIAQGETLTVWLLSLIVAEDLDTSAVHHTLFYDRDRAAEHPASPVWPMLNMSTHSTSLGSLPDEDGALIHHDDAMEESQVAVTGVSRRSSIMSITSSDSVQTETFDAENSPRLHRQGTMLSLSTHYSESSFGSHTELSGTIIARRVSNAGMRHRNQKGDFGMSIARERRKRLQQERLNRAVRPAEKAPETVLKTMSEPRSPEELGGAQPVPVAKLDGKVMLEGDEMPKPGIAVQQRAASAEATARMILHAKELLNASNATILRLKNSQDETKRGDGLVPQRRHTTGVLPQGTAARLKSKRATADGLERVDRAASSLGGIYHASDRVQELMAQFDREFRERVEANIKQRRRQKQGISFSDPHVLGEPKESDIGRNKIADQAPRPNMTEQDPALSMSETIVADEEEPIGDSEVWMAGRSPTSLGDTYEKVGCLNRTVSVEDEPSARLDLSIISWYDEESVVPEHAVAAPMVPVRKARLVKVAPRPINGHHAENEDGAFRAEPRSQPSQMGLSRSPNHISTNPDLVVGKNDGVSSPRIGPSKWEMKLAQSLQPEDFVVSTDPREEWAQETERKYLRPTSPFQRPSAALSFRLEEQFQERFEKEEGRKEKQKEEDYISLFSVDCATDTEQTALLAVPLFNMPNSTFLYHTEKDDECPSLTTDDDQDRRMEETRLGSQDMTPPTPSSPFRLGRGLVKSQDSLRETKGWLTSVEVARSLAPTRASENLVNSTNATTWGKPVGVNVEVEGDGFSIGDNLYQGQTCDGCEGTSWTKHDSH